MWTEIVKANTTSGGAFKLPGFRGGTSKVQEIPAILEEIDNSSTTHQQRVKISDRLAEIGDPRPGVGLRGDGLPDIVWCEVQGGKITLEKTGKTFTIDPFCISKYPVTWIQYRSFLEAEDGYRSKNGIT